MNTTLWRQGGLRDASWGIPVHYLLYFVKRCKRPDLAALMLRQSSGSAAQWASPFNTSWADSVTSVQGVEGV